MHDKTESQTRFCFFVGGAMAALRVYLRDDERQALLKLAQAERRDLAPQAALIIRQTLIERGLLPADVTRAETPKPVIDGWGRVITGGNHDNG